MPTFSSPVDGTTLFYRYYEPDSTVSPPKSSPAQPTTLVFLHGWPMSSRMFDQLLVPLCETHRFRCIAPDRRGFGNSDWNNPKTGPISYDTLTSDLIALLEYLNPGPFVFVCASMGCPESLLAYNTSHFIRQHCRGLVWIGPNMPYNTRCDASPCSPGPEVWEFLKAGFRGAEGKEFIAEQIPGVFRSDLNPMGQRVLRFFEKLAIQADPLALERMVTVMNKPMASELQKFVEDQGGEKMPVMILHGDSDMGMPLEVSAVKVKEMVPWAELKVYEKAGHGLYLTHSQQVLDHLIQFIEGTTSRLM